MTVLAADRNTAHQDGELIQIGVAAVKVYAGGMAAKNASGYATPAADAASLVVMGMFEEQVDNAAGAAGAKTVMIRRGRAFWFANSGTNAVTIAHRGQPCYVEDDQTVASAGGTNNIVAGLVLAVDAANGVLVWLGHIGKAANQADSVAADVATLKTDFNALLAKLQAAGLMES